MGVILVDSQQDDRSENCNWWNWRPTIELIRSLGLIDDERLDLMGSNAGAEVTQQEAQAIGKFIAKRVLPGLRPGQRVLLDLTVTDAPDDGTFYREPGEQHKNYSATERWLRRFADFCKECHGFRVY
jgi:hypothetical protein